MNALNFNPQVGDKVRFIDNPNKQNAVALAKENGLVVGKVYTVEEAFMISGMPTICVEGVDICFITDIFESGDEGEEAWWTIEIVYRMYCNDNLETLPIKILEQMVEYIQQIIDSKKK